MKVCAMVDRSAGNESVGEMWTETAEFDESVPISRVLEWAGMIRISDRFTSNEIISERKFNERINVRIAILQEKR